jgi:hypothetical protein
VQAASKNERRREKGIMCDDAVKRQWCMCMREKEGRVLEKDE